jgi:hypothetical protein
MHNEFVKYIRRGRAQANVSGVLYDSEGRNGKVPCKIAFHELLLLKRGRERKSENGPALFIDSVWIDERLKLLYY